MSKCKYGSECTFAHGEHELLWKAHVHSNYRTKECKNFFNKGYCTYGERCQFYHSQKPVHLQDLHKGSFKVVLGNIRTYHKSHPETLLNRGRVASG